jgi:hypothetical protein
MANKTFNKVQAYEKEVKHLYADVAIGASGAPTLTRGYGITSIARNSAGKYTVTLSDKYNRLMFADVVQLVGTAEDTNFQLVSESVASAKTVVFHCLTGGVATDPSSGSRLFIKLELKNSSVV